MGFLLIQMVKNLMYHLQNEILTRKILYSSNNFLWGKNFTSENAHFTEYRDTRTYGGSLVYRGLHA